MGWASVCVSSLRGLDLSRRQRPARETPGEPLRRVTGSEGEPHDRPERICGGGTDKVQARDRRLEVWRQDRRLIRASDSGQKLRTHERQPGQIDFVSGCRNYMICCERFFDTCFIGKFEAYAIIPKACPSN